LRKSRKRAIQSKSNRPNVNEHGESIKSLSDVAVLLLGAYNKSADKTKGHQMTTASYPTNSSSCKAQNKTIIKSMQFDRLTTLRANGGCCSCITVL